MSKRTVLMSVLLTMVVSLAGMSAVAATIYTSGATPFVYQGRSYVPLKSTADFLGAPVRWDAEKRQAVMTYRGEDLSLTPNNRNALLAGRPVVLSSAPVVVRGVTYVPADALRKHYNIPVTWDHNRSEVSIKGPNGWRRMKASSRSPWHGGPPPWAPAWGQRGYRAPGHPSYAKPSGSGNTKAWGQRGYVAPRHPVNVKPNVIGKTSVNKKDR